MFFQGIVPEEDAVPGAVIAIQGFGDFLGFNPHVHIIDTLRKPSRHSLTQRPHILWTLFR